MRQREPRRVGEGPRSPGGALGGPKVEPTLPDPLGDVEVEAEKIAVIRHTNILAIVAAFFLWRHARLLLRIAGRFAQHVEIALVRE